MNKVKLSDILNYSILLISCVLILGPVFWALSTAIKSRAQIFTYPPIIFPSKPFFGNFTSEFFLKIFLRYLSNTLFVALVTILVSVTIAFLAAYSAARYDYKGKDTILFLLWATIMVPGICILVPLYILAARLGLYDSYIILILVYSAWLIPTMTWLLKSFIESIPPEIDEMATIDGCSRLQIIYYIILPIAKPGLAAAAVLGFVYVWNDFTRAYTLTISDKYRTVQTGLYFMISDWGVEWGPMMAAVITTLIPILIMFFLLQRYFIYGLSSGAVKG